MTSTIRWRHPRKNKASVTPSGYFTEYDSSKEMNNLSVLPPSLKEPVSAPKTSTLPGSFTPPSPYPSSSSMLKNSKDDFQQILKVVLKARTPIVTAPLPEDPWERPLKPRFSDVYWDKTHLMCYNFCPQCKDHFATAEPKGSNCISFTTLFSQDRAPLR